MTEYLILTDEADKCVGIMEKLLVHKLGLLHRAFSVFIFNTKGEMLLQQRADKKYHSAGLWSNACCSHPRYNESIIDAVERRLAEEMGMFSKTAFAFSFIYKIVFENDLTEHEYDHVYIGITDDKPFPNLAEVKSWKYIDVEVLQNDVIENPPLYTEWLKICLKQVLEHYDNSFLKHSPKKYNLVSI